MYNQKYSKDLAIHMSVGNSKIGKIANFSTLPTDGYLSNSTQGQLTNVKGTCAGVCDGCKHACYAVNSAKRYSSSCIPSWTDNTLMIRYNTKKAFAQMKEYLIKHKVKVFRYNVSGEIENMKQLLGLVELAKSLPNVKMYFYTKKFDLMQEYLKDNKFPDNLVCNLSEWHDNLKNYDLKGVNRFVYDDHISDEVAKLKHCPAVDLKGHRTGISCEQCGMCYRNDGHRIAVHAH